MATTNLGKVSVTPKGEYDPLITYERLDVISHNGSSYIVKQASTGVTPIEGEFYALIAEKGDGGSFVKKAYKTYAAMDADKVSIPANSSVDVTNDPDESKNGAYIYDGVAFTRSQYDSKVVTDKVIADTAIAVQDAINSTAVEGGVLADTFVTATANGVGSVARTQRDKNSDSVSILDFGSASDINSYSLAYASGRDIYIPDGSFNVTASTEAQVSDFMGLLPRLTGCYGALNVTLGSSKVNIPHMLQIRSNLAKLTITGTTLTRQLVGIASVTAGAFNIRHWDSVFKDLPYHTVTYILDNTVGIEVGDYVIVRGFSGTDGLQHSGVWEVTAVAGNKINVLTTLHHAPPTSGITGTITVVKTVLSFGTTGSGYSAITAEQGGHLGVLDKLVLAGTCRPVALGGRTPANYDVAGGFGGVSGVIARDGGSLRFGSILGVSGFSGTNATSNRAGSILTTGVSSGAARNGWSAAGAASTQAQNAVSSGNLIDGFISQDGSFNFAKASVSVGNHRHGAISAGNGSLNFDNGYAYGNGGDGFNAIVSTGSGNGATFSGNSGCGIRAINGSTLRCIGMIAQNNVSAGIEVYEAAVTANSGTVSNNGTFDINARAKGTISIIGKVGTPTTNIPINAISAELSYIQDVSTLSTTRFTDSFAVGASGNSVNAMYAKRVTTVGFDPIPAQSSQTTTVTVEGVDSTKNNVVLISRDSTAIRTGILYKGVVSAANTVTISANNITANTITPPNENFNIMVWQIN